MRIADLYDTLNSKGIFFYINEYTPLSLSQVVDIDLLDILFKSKHGDRELSPLAKSVVGNEYPTVLQMELLGKLLSTYASKWNNLYDIYLEDVSLDSFKMTTIEDESSNTTDKQDLTSSVESTDSEHVSGYDADELVKNSENVRADSDTSTVDGIKDDTRQLNRTVVGSQGNRLEDRAKALQLLDQTYLDTVMKDVANELGLLIYN